jgi:hypothetical protein
MPNGKIKEKIKNLLALSKSPNDKEAQSAILKAHELMKKYNISPEEIYISSNNSVANNNMSYRDEFTTPINNEENSELSKEEQLTRVKSIFAPQVIIFSFLALLGFFNIEFFRIMVTCAIGTLAMGISLWIMIKMEKEGSNDNSLWVFPSGFVFIVAIMFLKYIVY